MGFRDVIARIGRGNGEPCNPMDDRYVILRRELRLKPGEYLVLRVNSRGMVVRSFPVDSGNGGRLYRGDVHRGA